MDHDTAKYRQKYEHYFNFISKVTVIISIIMIFCWEMRTLLLEVGIQCMDDNLHYYYSILLGAIVVVHGLDSCYQSMSWFAVVYSIQFI